jgi:hypothetical protein
MNDIENILESFKNLSDLELEIVFVDGVFKKLKQLDKQGIRSETLLFMYMSIIETLKKFKTIALEGKRNIPHEAIINIAINKGEDFLRSVANDENLAKHVSKSLSDESDLIKELLLILKSEMVELPEYSNLKQ